VEPTVPVLEELVPLRARKVLSLQDARAVPPPIIPPALVQNQAPDPAAAPPTKFPEQKELEMMEKA
jgi:hypothetical protein